MSIRTIPTPPAFDGWIAGGKFSPAAQEFISELIRAMEEAKAEIATLAADLEIATPPAKTATAWFEKGSTPTFPTYAAATETAGPVTLAFTPGKTNSRLAIQIGVHVYASANTDFTISLTVNGAIVDSQIVVSGVVGVFPQYNLVFQREPAGIAETYGFSLKSSVATGNFRPGGGNYIQVTEGE